MKTLHVFKNYSFLLFAAVLCATVWLLVGDNTPNFLHFNTTGFSPQLSKDPDLVNKQTQKAAKLLALHDQYMYSNLEKAHDYNDQALKIATELQANGLLFTAYGNKGTEYFSIGDLDKALYYYKKSYALINEKDEPLLMAINLSNICNVYTLKGNYSMSMECAYRAIKLCEKSPKGQELKCHTRANLAELHIFLGQFEKATYLLNLNLKELQQLALPAVKAITLSYMGLVYQNKKETKKAIGYLKQALHESEPSKLDNISASLCANLSDLYLGNHQLDLALSYARRAQQLSMVNDDAQVQTQTAQNMTRIFIQFDQLDSASYYAKLALSITQHKGIKSLQPAVLRTYAELLKYRKEYTASLEVLRSARKLSDSLFSEEIKNESTLRLEAFSEQESKQKMDLQYADQLHREKTLLFFALSFFGLALIIGWGVYSLYRQRQSVNIMLTKSGVNIESQRGELLRLNQIKDQLFSAITRELRTPLQNIQQVLANMDQLTTPTTNEQESTVLGQIQKQTVRTINLLEDLLFSARVQMQQYQPLRQTFQLKALTDELNKNLRILGDRPFLPILYHVPEDLYLYSDVTMLKMALRNLLLMVANRPDKSNVPVTLSAWRQDGYVYIRIADVDEPAHYLPYDAEAENAWSIPKSYWDVSLIKTFIETNGGKIYTCPLGKGYDIVVADALPS